MRVVYYKFPQGGLPENVVVFETPTEECEIALMVSKEDRELPLFYVTAEDGVVRVEEGAGGYLEEAMFVQYEDGFEAVIHARNAGDAHSWGKFFYDRLTKFTLERQSEESGVHGNDTRE